MSSLASISFHLTCGQSKKLVTCTASALKQRINEIFSLSDGKYIIQTWDTEFDDWIDVENVSVLEGQQKCKLQIVVT